MSKEIACPHRQVTIDGNGWLCPTEGDPIDIIADHMFAVCVLWNASDTSSWVGWLTTTSRRFVRFSADDLDDPVFQNWLRSLPGWEHERLWRATTCLGLHLVWRRPDPNGIPRP